MVSVASTLAFVQFREKPSSAEVVRFQISLPHQTSFTFAVPHVSPDGRRLAFLSGGADGRNQVWIRSLDSLESRPLAGTEGAVIVRSGPRTAGLGFVAQHKLKIVAASGGPPQTVCNLPAVPRAQSGDYSEGRGVAAG